MIAKKDVKKGEMIDLINAELINFPSSLHTLNSGSGVFFRTDFCGMCACSIEITGESKCISDLPQCQISKDCIPIGIPSDFKYFCSSGCMKKSQSVDVIIDGEFRATRKFFERIQRSSDHPNIEDCALYAAANFYVKLLLGRDNIDEKLKQILETYQKTDNSEIDERVMECWIIIRSDIESSKSKAYYKGVINAEEFSAIYCVFRQKCIHEISISHPLKHYIEQQILKLSDDDLKSALKFLEESNLPKAQFRDNDKLQASEKVLRWRFAARLVQAVSGNMLEEEVLSLMYDKQEIKSLKLLQNQCFILCSNLWEFTHSCVPNCIVQAIASDSGTGPLKVGLIALRDIQKGTRLTLSMIDDLAMKYEDRQKALRQILGSGEHICECLRCRCETLWSDKGDISVYCDAGVRDTNQESFHISDIKAIGDLSMQHSKYKYAYDLYKIILRSQPNNGDVLHASCASLLERGYVHQAQEMWKEANQICTDHDGISLQIKKQNAYEQDGGDHETAKGQNICMNTVKLQEGSYETLISSQAFVTKRATPIISDDECSQAIRWAEEAARSREGGWTTSRHYAVPTTDMPLHEIPKLLHWFNGVLGNRLRPLLAMQFGEQEVGKNGLDVFIHDAFVVRYDACDGQKHLPLHRDQSTHSFTIALNSTSEYDGGGTYIAALKRAVVVGKGGALSFKGGQLLHGGDPVVSGRRYIIVAFCYVAKSKSIKSDRPTLKKLKMDSVFHKLNTGNGSDVNEGFSFGFRL